jgi:type IV pilus assembly protein PilE
MYNRSSTKGVTLVELIVVLTIVALLAVIGYPSYETYLIESRRSDAINTLRENQLLLENYLQTNSVMPTSGQVTIITSSPGGFYDIAYTRVSDTRFKLVATAVSTKSQNNDTGCTTITLVSEMENVYPPECH